MREPARHDEIRDIERIPGVASLGEAITFLRETEFEGGQANIRSFEIDPTTHPVQGNDLKKLLSFPFEFSLHERGGNIVVATGDKSHPGDSKIIGVPKDTMLYAHTHPQTSSMTFVSFSDIFTTDKLGAKAQHVLITKDGLVVYKRPQRDPIRDVPTDESPREIMSEWGDQRGINLFSRNPREGYKHFFDLPDDEKMQIARDFVTDTGMLIMETGWEDQENVQKIVDAINQTTVISDNQTPKLSSVLDDLHVDLDSLDLDERTRANIEDVVTHIDSVKYKKGRLFKDRNMRQGWKEFAAKLADQVIDENPSESVKDLLSKLKSKAKELSID